MCSKNEYTKSESNSQHGFQHYYADVNCVQRTNIQNLKAIHNRFYCVSNQHILCSKNEYTKSESNSQQPEAWCLSYSYCVQRTNIQNLKAIHNTIPFLVMLYLLCSKNEYTKSESNSQRSIRRDSHKYIVFKERIYKIWKQFTTASARGLARTLLCSKNEYTKSESNSQHKLIADENLAYCVQRTNIQNLKAIHNTEPLCITENRIVFKERIYKIWKQFTTRCLC